MDTREQREQKTEQLRERLLACVARTEMGYSERFEHDAERFYRETGLMAPGKSVPLEMWSDDMDRRRREAWDEFQAKLRAEFIAMLHEAAAALGEPSASGAGLVGECDRALDLLERASFVVEPACVVVRYNDAMHVLLYLRAGLRELASVWMDAAERCAPRKGTPQFQRDASRFNALRECAVALLAPEELC